MSGATVDPNAANAVRATGPNSATSAPWVAEPVEHDELGEWSIRDSDGMEVARVYNPYGDYALARAFVADERHNYIETDARKMAAAHELLAALKEAIGVLESAATAEARANLAPTGLSKRTDAADRLARAKAAIAKATGQ